MRLIGHELYKIFKNKSIYVLLVIVLVLNGVYFGLQLRYSKVDETVKKSMLSMLQGPITEEKVTIADGGLRKINLQNRRGASWVSNPEQVYIVNAYAKLLNINGAYYQKQETLREINPGSGTGFAQKNNKLLYDMTQRTAIREYRDTGGWDSTISYTGTYGAVIMAAFILLGLSAMFSGEYESKVDSLILSSRYGKTRLIWAKILAALIFIVGLAFSLSLVNLVENLIVFGTTGWDAPAQCLMNLYYTPYQITVLQYYGIQLFVHIIGCIAFGLFVLLASSLAKSRIMTFFIGTFVFILPYILDNTLQMKKTLANILTDLSMPWAMGAWKLFEAYKAYNILDNPVTYPVVALILMGLMIIGFCIYTARVFRNHGMNY